MRYVMRHRTILKDSRPGAFTASGFSFGQAVTKVNKDGDDSRPGTVQRDIYILDFVEVMYFMSMTDNSIKLSDCDLSIYDNKIMSLADEYITQNNLQDKKEIHDSFLDMINYITYIHGVRFTIDQVDELKKCFNCLILLCEKYEYIPTTYLFSKFIVDDGLSDNNNTLKCDIYAVNQGRKKASQEYKALVKNIMLTCKHALVETVTQSRGADVNRIFILKAIHGLAETQPQTVEDVQRQGTSDLIAGMGLSLPETH